MRTADRTLCGRIGTDCAAQRTPQAYLTLSNRAAMSGPAMLDEAAVSNATTRLTDDLEQGVSHGSNADLLDAAEFDLGYRLVATQGWRE